MFSKSFQHKTGSDDFLYYPSFFNILIIMLIFNYIMFTLLQYGACLKRSFGQILKIKHSLSYSFVPLKL